MKLYHVRGGVVVESDGRFVRLGGGWDEWVNLDGIHARLLEEIEKVADSSRLPGLPDEILPPVGTQEVWAAGVTYLRSRSARVEESRSAGGGSFYDRVYDAERPELFPKATARRVVGHGGEIRVRKDARWSVPEPELALVVNSRAEIVGYTVGNDVSSRDIEGENPLYLPQAKFYDGACALGPGVLLGNQPLPPTTEIRLEIRRDHDTVFEGATTLDQMRRSPRDLVEYLYRETSFPSGCVLLTGTGIVPGEDFTLRARDEVRIAIDPIGTLVNRVAAE